MELKTFFDFCSGVGGGRIGLENCGLKCVGSSDTSRLSNTTYQIMHKPTDEKNYGNLKTLKCETLPEFDVLIAGFPCQTFSVIGRKAGLNDDRGQIIFHLARIITETKPKAFILENVRGLVTHDKGETLKIIMKLLRDSGFIVSYKVLSSIEYGVPQMRQRVYFIGIRNDLNVDLDTFKWPEVKERPPLSDYLIDENNDITEENYIRFSYYLKNSTNNGLYVPEDFLCEPYLIIDTRMSDLRLYRGRVPTLRSQRDGVFYIKNGKIKQLTGYEALLLQGFPKNLVDKVKHSVTDRHLLMQAGNAMTVNVIEGLGKSLLNLKEKRSIKNMSNWSDFEQSAFNYLSNKYPQAKFIKQGERDSNLSDISVKTSNNKNFSIETKMNSAQSGQFVLLPDFNSNTFIYSSENKYAINDYSQEIMNYMNDRFDVFKSAGTKGAKIDMDHQIFIDWITTYYKSKGVKYFITADKNDYIIFPCDKFSDYFNVSAVFRGKKSGSNHPSKKNITEVLSLLEKSNISYSIIPNDKKMYVSSADIYDDMRLVGDKYTYKFADKGDSFEVRQLSITCNSNVIFSIKLKSKQNITDLKLFESEI